MLINDASIIFFDTYSWITICIADAVMLLLLQTDHKYVCILANFLNTFKFKSSIHLPQNPKCTLKLMWSFSNPIVVGHIPT